MSKPAAPVHLATPDLDAHCDRMHHRGDVVVLEGNVLLLVKKHAQPIRIEAQRVLVNMRDGSFTVESGLAPVTSPGNNLLRSSFHRNARHAFPDPGARPERRNDDARRPGSAGVDDNGTQLRSAATCSGAGRSSHSALITSTGLRLALARRRASAILHVVRIYTSVGLVERTREAHRLVGGPHGYARLTLRPWRMICVKADRAEHERKRKSLRLLRKHSFIRRRRADSLGHLAIGRSAIGPAIA